MASVSVSHLIIFIASIVVAASVAGTMTTGVNRLSNAIDDGSLDMAQEVRSDVEVISDAGGTVYNRSGDGKLTLLVKNTGSTTFPADATAVDLIVDGAYQVNVTVTPVSGPPDSWGDGEVVRVEASMPDLPAGDHRAKLVVGGDEEVFAFRT